MIVTIDGPAGTGKSTAARGLAERLQFHFLDTGAMYRAVGLLCLERGVDPADEESAAGVAEHCRIEFDGRRTLIDDRDASVEIRSGEAARAASIVAQNRRVREELVSQQRRIADGLDIVCEGRDQGTVAFPHAECKFFLTAAAEERARRRQLELADRGEHVPFDRLLADQNERDRRDQHRAFAPLIAAADAITIDTTHLDAKSVLDELERFVRERMT